VKRRSAQPQEYGVHDLISPGGAADLKNGGSKPKQTKTNENIIERRHFKKNILSCPKNMELNLMRGIYGKESAAPPGACLTGILRSRGCAPRCGASPRAIAPSAPPAPNINVETPGRGLSRDLVFCLEQGTGNRKRETLFSNQGIGLKKNSG
jgi:hypothetical protein